MKESNRVVGMEKKCKAPMWHPMFQRLIEEVHRLILKTEGGELFEWWYFMRLYRFLLEYGTHADRRYGRRPSWKDLSHLVQHCTLNAAVPMPTELQERKILAAVKEAFDWRDTHLELTTFTPLPPGEQNVFPKRSALADGPSRNAVAAARRKPVKVGRRRG